MTGKEILTRALVEFDVSPADFFGPGRCEALSSARREVCLRLQAAGKKTCEIARIMGRDHSAVSYWLRPDLRAHRRAYYQGYNARIRQIQGHVPKAHSNEKLSELQRQILLVTFASGDMASVEELQILFGVNPIYTRSLAFRRSVAPKPDGYQRSPVRGSGIDVIFKRSGAC